MKKLDQFLVKAFIGPFLGILVVVVFILMMQFLWLYIDELVGKGLGLKVIAEFLGWGAATLLPLSLPLATLLGSVMTIGQLSENNELIAMKSSGLSLARILAPLFICSVLISIGAFFAGNNLVPVAYGKIYSLRDDIGKTKEEINIPEGTFYNGIEGYILRIQSRDKATGMMHGVMVYDHTGNNGNISVTIADSALMTMSKAKDYLTFSMFSGINYQETNRLNYTDTTFQIQRIGFNEQKLIISLKNYAFQKSDDNRFGDQAKAMSNKNLNVYIDSLRHTIDSSRNISMTLLNRSQNLKFHQQLDTSFRMEGKQPFDFESISWSEGINGEIRGLNEAMQEIQDLATYVRNIGTETNAYNISLRRYRVEFLKKSAQALMCLILFLIGAPLGAFINKRGGMGVSMIIAAMFFVLYWVIDITGTKLARDGAVGPMVGVFISTVILLPVGIFLTIKAIQDAKLFNTDNFKNWWRKTKSKVMSTFRKTRIVYMGTPEFAVAPLDALIKAKHNIVGVVTVADKPSGRGLKMNESAVKKYAVEHGIPVLQPVKLKDPEFLKELSALKADIFVVVAFRMLPEEVWAMPPMGTFNLHAALLPQYRGAAPINWAVINGERMTGVTTFMIDKDIDTGGIILRQEYRIPEGATAGDVHDALMPIGADLVVQTVEGIIEKTIETRVQRSFIQGSEVLKPAPKLTRELCHIDWNAPARSIVNLIRGLSPYPTAYTELGKDGAEPSQMKIFNAEVMEKPHGAEAGTVITDGKSFFAIAAEDAAVSIKDLQLSGKKRMDVKAFLAGFRDPETYHAISKSDL